MKSRRRWYKDKGREWMRNMMVMGLDGRSREEKRMKSADKTVNDEDENVLRRRWNGILGLRSGKRDGMRGVLCAKSLLAIITIRIRIHRLSPLLRHQHHNHNLPHRPPPTTIHNNTKHKRKTQCGSSKSSPSPHPSSPPPTQRAPQ